MARRRPPLAGQNRLWHGDNLDVLRAMSSESVDLVYLDPPFKSNRTYNMLYSERDGSRSAAQQKAFSDTWRWDPKAAKAYRQTVEAGGSVADVMEGFRRILSDGGGTQRRGRSEMLAYLSMMAPRLIELRRVLKPTGSLYLHCDPSASHYLKLLLDAVFGPEKFRNEIIWKRTSSHNDPRKYGNVHDTILFYSKSDSYKWHTIYGQYSDEYVTKEFRPDKDGRLVKYENLTAPSHGRNAGRFEWRGTTPPPSRMWRFKIDKLEELFTQHRIKTRPNGTPIMRGLKTYLTDLPGVPVQSVWTDLVRLGNTSKERIGFPTQKPVLLLKRIIESCTDEGDTVLDPFCGCGSTIEAAEDTHRKWIGIDITHLAIEVIEDRLAKLGVVEGRDYIEDCRFAPPTLPDVEALAHKDKHAFQGWALQQAGVEAFQLKPGPDRGIDARKVFFDPPGSTERREIIVSVKGGNLPATCVRDLIGTVQRERAQIGVLITLKPPTKNMIRDAAEAPTYRGRDGRVYSGIQILTVKDLLDGHTLEYPLQLAVANTSPVVPATAAPRSFELESQLPRRRPMAKVAAFPLGFGEQKERAKRR